ncbi:hypothetical protein [uncultured Fluviicola sp.]|uniref:hypothetical protein n=1 Tax=uncultured Fluviicola sp. TaxID=463303 RepID=UPI0025E9950E|nr:hypothetical protein [uncultured Fluviicola sp.]
MTQPEFKKFIEKTLDELKLAAEIHANISLPDIGSFQWMREGAPIYRTRIDIIDAICKEVYIDPNNIYPCVDLQISYNKDKTALAVRGFIANYSPRPFQRGWSNRPGPFIYAISTALNSPEIDMNSESFKIKMFELGLWHKPPNDENK